MTYFAIELKGATREIQVVVVAETLSEAQEKLEQLYPDAEIVFVQKASVDNIIT